MLPSPSFPLAKGSRAPYWLGGIILSTLTAVPVFVAIMSFAPRFVRFDVGPQGIAIHKDLYGRQIPWEKIEVKRGTEIAYADLAGLRPTLRTNGVGLSNYS